MFLDARRNCFHFNKKIERGKYVIIMLCKLKEVALLNSRAEHKSVQDTLNRFQSQVHWIMFYPRVSRNCSTVVIIILYIRARSQTATY